ncbi:MAG: hypothetical protein ACRC1P_02490 [Cellulosilyticaceae bacterium]
MIDPIKRLGGYAFVLFGILFVWSICLASAQKLENLKTSMELRYHEPTFTLEQLEKIQTEETNDEKRMTTNLVAWRQIPQIVASNKELEKSTKSAMIYVFGDLGSLISKNQVTGDLIYQGDDKGAIITKKVAYDLWGSLEVIGKTFYYEEQVYHVSGVLDEETPAIIVQLTKANEEDMKLNQLRVQFIDSENIERQLEIFRSRYGLAETTAINLSLMSIVLTQIVYLPMWMAGIGGLIKLYKLCYATYQYWVATIILMIITVGITALMVKFMTIQFNIPAYLIPNQWSDFEFWSELWKKMSTNHLEIQSLPKYLPDLWRAQIIQTLLVTWGISSLGTIVGIRKMNIREGKQLFIQVLGASVISFFTVIISYKVGIVFIVPEALWGIVPLFMLIQYICNNWKRLLE